MDGFHDIIVFKFGGSVLEDGDSIVRAAGLVREALHRGLGVVVVVSALRGVTDQLMELSRRVNPGVEPWLLDEILASGERTSARLVAAALAAQGVRPVVVDPEGPYWPIFTDDRHLDANPLLEECRRRVEERILPLVREGMVPVVCGFLGKTRDGKTTTLGRGGSDTTAVVLGHCIGAGEVVLFKDVGGVYSGDPGRVGDPIPVAELDAVEAVGLAAGGARLIHGKALRYLRPGMRIRVTGLDRPDGGTVIRGGLPELSLEPPQQPVSMMTLVGLDSSKMESVMRVVAAIEEAGGRLLAFTLDPSSGVFYVAGGDVLDRVHRYIVRGRVGKVVSSFDGLAMITIRGVALETVPGVIQAVAQSLAREGINLYGLVTILSSIRVFISSDRVGEALRLLGEAIGRGDR